MRLVLGTSAAPLDQAITPGFTVPNSIGDGPELFSAANSSVVVTGCLKLDDAVIEARVDKSNSQPIEHQHDGHT